MYAFYAALAAALLAFAATAAWLGPIAGIVPALLAFSVVAFWVVNERRKAVDAELIPLTQLLQGTQPRTPAEATALVDKAQALLREVQQRHKNWYPGLEGQLDAQIGLLDYQLMRFDEALPRLVAGKWRNAVALASIGCIHHRKGRKAEADAAFAEAESAAPKEVLVYLVPAVLAARASEQDKALATLARGLKELPGNPVLSTLQSRIANKRKIEAADLTPGWYQYFPEDVAKHHRATGQLPPGMNAPPPPPMNRKMRRAR